MHFGRDDELLRAAVLGEGAELTGYRVDQVHQQPGGALTVCYVATCRRGAIEADEYLCVSNAELSQFAAQRTDHVVLSDGGRRVTVWRRPCDPELPALMRSLIPPAGGQVSLHSYRPLRRAVVVARDARGARRYRKVVRPGQAHALRERHDACTDAGLPVPHVVDYGSDGLIELSAVAGEPLLGVLAGGRDFDIGGVIALLESLPGSLMRQPERPPWTRRTRTYAELAAAQFPELAPAIGQVAEAVTARMAATPAGELVPTHGDLYEAQLYVAGGAISGIVDLDTAGPGYRSDDLACLLGHLAALPHFDVRFAHVAGRMPAWFSLIEQYARPAGLGVRVAAVLITLLGTADAGHATRETQLARAHGMLGEARRYLAA